VTEPDEGLKPERLSAGEVGIIFSRGRVSTRTTGFLNVLEDAIVDRTVSTSPSLIVRQLADVDSLRSTGVEFEGAVRLPRGISVAATAALASSRFQGEPSLANRRVPQVPTYTFGLNVRYDNSVWMASGQLRMSGPQWADDVNALRIRRAAVLDLVAGRTMARKLNGFVAVENVFDSEYDVGRTPARLVGLPRALRGGVQLAFP
jgi:outer membrane receptor protein involved in Fe transport